MKGRINMSYPCIKHCDKDCECCYECIKRKSDIVCDYCESKIYDKYYLIKGEIYCKDCLEDLCERYID